ncbi:MAG: hypothetical protein ACHRHE_13045, partial [Tepidisphaerales bacterium]
AVAVVAVTLAGSAAETPRPRPAAGAARPAAPVPAGAPAADVKFGLAGMLADEDKVLTEVSAREMVTLRDYLFDKRKLPPEERARFRAWAAINELLKPNVPASRRGQLIKDVSVGIDDILKLATDPTKLLTLNKQLVDFGTKRALNVMEYWPANPKTQAQVRPVAEAVDKVYAKAIEVAEKQARDIESKMNAANQDVLGKQWEKLETLIGVAKFSRAFNLYTVALSMDKSDAKRVDVAKKGVEILTEYEDPSFEIQDQCRVGIAKLWMVAGPENVGQARNKFAEVLASKKATWGQKFEAIYFTAVTDLLDGKPAEARKGKAAVEEWLKANPPEDPKTAEETKKGVEAAVDMLEYRIISYEADKSAGPAREKANTEAIAVLDKLARSRPDLEGIINDQMMAKLPDNPDIKSINNRLLHALASRGNDELMKPEGQPTDKHAVELAVAAAREIIARTGKEGIAPDDVENSMLLLAYFQLKLDKPVEAANTFLDFVKQYPRSQHLSAAFENAMSLAAKLKREQADARATQEIYIRFLEVATAPPFNRREFNLEYAQFMLRRNLAAMEADYDNAKREAMIALAKRAVALCAAVGNDEKRAIYAKFNEMMAHDQIIDLDTKSPETPARMARMQALAGEINALVAKEMPGASADQARMLRIHKVQSSLLVANLAKHLEGDGRKAGMDQALGLLANFEKDVEGMPNADALLGEVRFLRVTFLMSLGRAPEALSDLQKFVETAGDRGIGVIVSMLDTLDKDFKLAIRTKDMTEAASLAANRAQVAGFLVDRVAQSKNEKLRALLPQYKEFLALANLAAAGLEKDPAKRTKLLESALAVFEPNASVELPETATAKEREALATAKLNVGYIQYELGNYLKARPVLAELLSSKALGTPRDIKGDGVEQVTKWNDSYWGATLKVMWCDVKLVEQKAPEYDEKTLKETRDYLKRLYIQWGEPGGPKWAPEFDRLKDALLPGWVPPPPEDAPTTRPMTRP